MKFLKKHKKHKYPNIFAVRKLSPEHFDQPENKCQYYRNDNTAGYRNIDAEVIRAEPQVAGQIEQTQFAKHQRQ